MIEDLLSKAEKIHKKQNHKKKNYKKALELYKQVLVLDSNNLKALLGLADCFYNLSENPIYAQQAIEISNQIIKTSPQLAKPYVILSYIESDINKSSEYAEKALNLEPNSEETLCCYGILMLRQEKSSEAVIYLEKAIQISPEMYLAHYNLLVAHSNLKDIKKQFKQSKILLGLKPNLRNLILFTSIYLGINKFLFFIQLVIPILYIWVPFKLLFVSHFLPVFLYTYGIFSALKYKSHNIINKNIIFIVFLLLLDVLIIFTSYILQSSTISLNS